MSDGPPIFPSQTPQLTLEHAFTIAVIEMYKLRKAQQTLDAELQDVMHRLSREDRRFLKGLTQLKVQDLMERAAADGFEISDGNLARSISRAEFVAELLEELQRMASQQFYGGGTSPQLGTPFERGSLEPPRSRNLQ